jgi:hypothetical protein
MPPASFSARKNPQRTQEGTSPASSRLRPSWTAFLSILVSFLKPTRNRKTVSDEFSCSSQQDASFPLPIRQASERLSTKVPQRQTSPFTIDPISDASPIAEALIGMRSGRAPSGREDILRDTPTRDCQIV